jgi:hypothetical protein
VFYVTDLTGKKVDSEPRQEAIRKRIVAVLEDKLEKTAPPA